MKTANQWFIGIPQRKDGIYEFTREEIVTLLESYAQQFKDVESRIERLVLDLDIFQKERLKQKDKDILFQLMAKISTEYFVVGEGKKTEIDWFPIYKFLQSKTEPQI